MANFFIFSNALSLCVVVSSSAISANLSLLREVCPYSTFCTAKPVMLLKAPDLSPCCVQCSCSDKCALAGNCCPDKSVPGYTEPIYPCRTQEEVLQHFLNREFENEFTLNTQFHVIDSCPSDAYYNSHLQIAISRCHWWRSLEAVTFVSDPRGEYVFLNKYCAACNGVDNFITWNLKIKCGDINLLKFNSFKQRDDYILNSCGILSFPPEGHVVTKSRCYKDSIKECNLTGIWDFYDEDIEEMCRKYNVPYDYMETIYANVFCFICNHPKETVYPTTCTNKLYIHSGYRDITLPFTALVSFQQEDGHTYERNFPGADKCGITEILDPFMRKCTDVYCPLGTIPRYGTCRHLVESTDGFCITLRLGVQKYDKFETEFAEKRAEQLVAFKKSLSEVLRAHRINCDISRSLLFDLNSEELLAETTIRTTRHCDHVKLLRAINVIVLGKTLNLNLNGRAVSTSVRLIVEAINTEALELIAFEELGYCVVGIVITSKTVYCPSIEYQRLDIVKKNMDSNITADIFKQSVQIEEQKYRICIDTYLSTFAETNLKAGGESKEIRTFSMQVIFVIICCLLKLPMSHTANYFGVTADR